MKQISWNWLKPTPPSFNNWKSNTNNILEMERLIYRIIIQEIEHLKRLEYVDCN